MKELGTRLQEYLPQMLESYFNQKPISFLFSGNLQNLNSQLDKLNLESTVDQVTKLLSQIRIFLTISLW